jgi:hypothetical protein
MISESVRAWCGTGALYIDPGSRWQSGIVEIFNGTQRDELLSPEIFDTLAKAQHTINRRRLTSNHQRIQSALGKMTPAALVAACAELPPLRLTAIACAAASPRTSGAPTMHQHR